MQITVNIPDEVAAQAQARGLTPENYVESLIAKQKLTAPVLKTDENLAERMAKLEEFFESFSANSENIPILPDEAYTRESFYSDHD